MQKSNLEQSKSIFAFLKDMQLLRSKPVKTISTYEKASGCWVHHLDKTPTKKKGVAFWGSIKNQEVGILNEDIESEGQLDNTIVEEIKDPILTIPKITPTEPPQPSAELGTWIDGDIEFISETPKLLERIEIENQSDGQVLTEMDIKDHPNLVKEFGEWQKKWQQWANESNDDLEIRKIYISLHNARDQIRDESQDWEFILGVGRLRLGLGTDKEIDRHIFTVPCIIDLDSTTGTIIVRVDDTENFSIEDDWIQGFKKPELSDLEIVREVLNKVDNLTLEEIKKELIKFSHKFRSDIATDFNTIDFSKKDSLVLAPSLILRKRGKKDLIKMLETLESLFEKADRIPAPLQSFLEPGYGDKPSSSDLSGDGAVVSIEDSLYLPLELNSMQLKALERADTRNATIIQGPPGTGKTRTIAVMVSHFLAKGQRVLVAAQTPQALREVRSQLPEEIRELAVASLGGGKADNDDLQKAVNALVAANENKTELIDGFEEFQKEQIRKIDEFHAERARIIRKIIDIREQETNSIDIEGVKGTPGHLAFVHLDQRNKFSWLSKISDPNAKAPNYTSSDAERISSELRQIWQSQFKVSSDTKLPTKEEIWSDIGFQKYLKLQSHKGKSDLELQIMPEHATQLLGLLEPAIDLQNSIKLSNPTWLNNAIDATNSFNENTYISRLENGSKMLEKIDLFLSQMGPISDIECPETNVEWLPILDGLTQKVLKKGALKLSVNGSIKKPVFSGTLRKNAYPILNQVKILGKSPNNIENFDRVKAIVHFDHLLKTFIKDLKIPLEAIPKNRYDRTIWLSEQTKIIEKTLALNTANIVIKEFLRKKLTKTNNYLYQPLDLEHLHNAVLAINAADELKEYDNKINTHIAKLQACVKGKETEYITNYIRDIKGINQDAFSKSRLILESHIEQLEYKKDLIEYISKLSSTDNLLVSTAVIWIDETHSADEEHEILNQVTDLVDAYKWKRLGESLGNKEINEYGRLFSAVTRCDDQIQKKVRELARRRSWKKALERIDAATIANMKRYALESRKLGAGTGVTAPRRRRIIRDYLTECIPSIPAWIMPIDLVAKSFTAELEMFDVVIVDEASQARLDSVFLLALSKRVVIVGDHKQVSPDSGMLPDAEVQTIVNRHLVNDPKKGNFSNADLSLFDACKIEFGTMITLTEHRRCVPEIIGFSNQIAYQPENIELIPVRQRGSDTLPPIKTIFVEKGYVRGSSGMQVNPPEAEAVAQEVLRMTKDPAYRNLTIGIITLQGSKQQEIIKSRLIDLVPTTEMESRQIRVGMPPDFQGSERNVILLSMVMAPNQRYTSQTKDLMVQRYNVAASRAKDQMVLVHSLRSTDIKNTADLRRQLIVYCQNVESGNQNPVQGAMGPVPNGELVHPFDSLFEQRVHNQIVARGYKVIPQFEPKIEGHDYRIDLVVVGPYGKYAIECDGEHWHGPDAFENDLVRQENLQRCGWKFFRIPESNFYQDPKYMDKLWEELEKFVSAKNIEVLTLTNENSNHTIGKELLMIDNTDKKEIYKETSSDKNQIGKNSSPKKRKNSKKKSIRQPLNDDADLWTKLEFYKTSASKYDSLNDENTTSQLTVESVENPWNEGELKSIKKELMEDLKLISNGLEILEADAGGGTFEIEYEKSLVYNARDLVQQIEWALDRIKNNTYGKCQECDNFIGKKRLKVFPRTTLCILCTS